MVVLLQDHRLFTSGEAHKIVGGLSNPSKMPGKGYNLPAKKCLIGPKLRPIPGTTCHHCYAHKGRYEYTR